MKIKILGTESLGVRGLCCIVETKNRKIVIDPGVALGWSRYGFLPHPFQVAIGAQIREKIIEELKDDATDVVFSHLDGDHIPLFNANPYQLKLDAVTDLLSNIRIWAKGPKYSSKNQRKRREEIEKAINKKLSATEGKKDNTLEFSFPVPHGAKGNKKGMVMMTKIKDEEEVFVHAADIQLLDTEAIEKVLDWKPSIVLASGPPLYHSLPETQREKAWKNGVNLAKNVDTLILDHHLLRSEEGMEWLKKLDQITKNRVICAAEFMQREPLFLETWREKLYQWLPAPKDWHEDYKHGKVDFNQYRIKGWESLIRKRKIKPCKWYYSCPIVKYTEQGKLDRYWIENYCLVSNKNCVRYKMEEKGEFHPDNMLPNGEIIEDLK